MMEKSDSELIKAVLGGDTHSFEKLIEKYQPRIFGTVRRYARTENEIEDIVQEIFIKAFRKLESFRGEAPFEHWLMRMAVRTCYDFLRKHQRSREHSFTDLTKDESNWLEQFVSDPDAVDVTQDGAKTLVERLMDSLSPQAKLVITLQEIEGKSIKEISDMTGWSISLVKIRAFRARNEMRKQLEKIQLDKYL